MYYTLFSMKPLIFCADWENKMPPWHLFNNALNGDFMWTVFVFFSSGWFTEISPFLLFQLAGMFLNTIWSQNTFLSVLRFCTKFKRIGIIKSLNKWFLLKPFVVYVLSSLLINKKSSLLSFLCCNKNFMLLLLIWKLNPNTTPLLTLISSRLRSY